MKKGFMENLGNLAGILAAAVVVITVFFYAGGDHTTLQYTAKRVEQHDAEIERIKGSNAGMDRRLGKVESKVGMPTP